MVKVMKIRGEYRVVEVDTNHIAKSKHGKPMDGGGFKTKAEAERQSGYINASPRRIK